MVARDGGLRPLFRERMRDFHWVTVETGSTGRGIPDSEYCSPGGLTGWIEYKLTSGSKVRLRPEQVAWHTKRALKGGRSFVVVRQKHAAGPRYGAAIDRLWIFSGGDARGLLANGLEQPTTWCSSWAFYGADGPARWEWNSVRARLTGTNLV